MSIFSPCRVKSSPMGQKKDKTEKEKQPSVSLGHNIREFRKARGWSQTDLAERIGSHLSHVNRVETGKYTPALDFVIKTALAFGVSVDALLADQNNPLDDVKIENKEVAERIRLIEALDANERDALFTVIDSMLTKKKMKDLLNADENRIHQER